MKKLIIFIFLSFLMIGTIGFFYINKIFLPIKVKNFLIEKGEQYLDRKIILDDIKLDFIKGLVLKNIEISQKDHPNKPFIKADEVSSTVLLIPFLKNKNIVLPRIIIINPFIYVERNEDSEWNFADLIYKKTSSRIKDSYFFFIKEISFLNGQINYTDKTRAEEFIEYFNDIDLYLSLSLDRKIKFKVKSSIYKKGTALNASGNVDISTKKISLKLLAKNFYFIDYLPYLYANENLNINNGFLPSCDLNVTYKDKSFNATGDITLSKIKTIIKNKNLNQHKTAEISGDFLGKKINVVYKDGRLRFQGEINSPDLLINLFSNKEIKGNLDANLNSLTLLKDSIDINGNIKLNNSSIKISQDINLKGNIDTKNLSLNQQSNEFKLSGNIYIGNSKLTFSPSNSIEGDFEGKLNNLTFKNNNLLIESTTNLKDALISLDKNRLIKGNIFLTKSLLSYKDGVLNFGSSAKINSADINLGSGINLTGNPVLDINYSIDFADKSIAPTYYGKTNFKDAKITGIPKLNVIDNIKGNISFKPNEISTNNLNVTALGANVFISGILSDFNDPKVDITAFSEKISIEKASSLLKEIVSKHDFNLSGSTALTCSYKGPIGDYKNSRINLTANLINADFVSKHIPDPVKNISGQINYSKENISWTNLKGNYKKTEYLLNGSLNNFLTPTIETKVVSNHYDFNTKFQFKDKIIYISFLTGTYLNSFVDVKGSVNTTNPQNLILDVNGNIKLSMKDLPILIKSYSDQIKKFSLEGILSGRFSYTGSYKNLSNSNLSINANTDNISISKYPFKNLNIAYVQQNKIINKLNLTSSLYNGNLTIDASGDLDSEDMLLNTKLELKGLNLGKLRKERKIRKKEFAGYLSSFADLKIPLRNYKKMKGNGSLLIEEGYLWQLIPQYKGVVFTDLKANFKVNNEKIITNNAEIISKPVILKAQGWIDFDKHLGFKIVPQPTATPNIKTGSVEIDPSVLLRRVVNIDCHGTIDSPTCVPELSPMKVLEGTTDIIREGIEGVGSILDGLF